jgi:hypothetical protein
MAGCGGWPAESDAGWGRDGHRGVRPGKRSLLETPKQMSSSYLMVVEMHTWSSDWKRVIINY